MICVKRSDSSQNRTSCAATQLLSFKTARVPKSNCVLIKIGARLG